MPAGNMRGPQGQVSEEYSQPLKRDRLAGMGEEEITFRAIGFVKPVQVNDVSTESTGEVSELVLRPELVRGLDGIGPGDRLMVIFAFDRAAECELRQHPRGDPRRPLRGVFALHSPRRTNPIGVTVVDVLEIEANIVRVRGLDAWPETPILDLKLEPKEAK